MQHVTPREIVEAARAFLRTDHEAEWQQTAGAYHAHGYDEAFIARRAARWRQQNAELLTLARRAVEVNLELLQSPWSTGISENLLAEAAVVFVPNLVLGDFTIDWPRQRPVIRG